MSSPCYYCELGRDTSCEACIHHWEGPSVEEVLKWKAKFDAEAEVVTVTWDVEIEQLRTVVEAAQKLEEVLGGGDEEWDALRSALAPFKVKA